MKISDLIATLEKAKTQYGDLCVTMTYWCKDCDDQHDGEGYRVVRVDDDCICLEVIRIGED